MALHYNLSKVYQLSDNDPEFVDQILELFLNEVPDDLLKVKEGIKLKNYQQTHAFAHKIKPSLDLIGLNIAYEEILQVEAWAKAEGKRREINDTFESIETQIKNAIKEIKKDFDK